MREHATLPPPRQRLENENGGWGQSSLLTFVIRERVLLNCRRILQNFSRAGVRSDRHQTSAGAESAGYDKKVPDAVDSGSCS